MTPCLPSASRCSVRSKRGLPFGRPRAFRASSRPLELAEATALLGRRVPARASSRPSEDGEESFGRPRAFVPRAGGPFQCHERFGGPRCGTLVTSRAEQRAPTTRELGIVPLRSCTEVPKGPVWAGVTPPNRAGAPHSFRLPGWRRTGRVQSGFSRAPRTCPPPRQHHWNADAPRCRSHGERARRLLV